MANIPGFRAVLKKATYSDGSPGSYFQTVLEIENDIVFGVTGVPIGGHRIVKKDSASLIQYASSANALDLGKVLGLSLEAATSSQPIMILRRGEIEEPSWNWALDIPIFVSVDGLLTQTIPSSPTDAFSQIVAYPITPTRILFGLREPMLLVT